MGVARVYSFSRPNRHRKLAFVGTVCTRQSPGLTVSASSMPEAALNPGLGGLFSSSFSTECQLRHLTIFDTFLFGRRSACGIIALCLEFDKAKTWMSPICFVF